MSPSHFCFLQQGKEGSIFIHSRICCMDGQNPGVDHISCVSHRALLFSHASAEGPAFFFSSRSLINLSSSSSSLLLGLRLLQQ